MDFYEILVLALVGLGFFGLIVYVAFYARAKD